MSDTIENTDTEDYKYDTGDDNDELSSSKPPSSTKSSKKSSKNKETVTSADSVIYIQKISAYDLFISGLVFIFFLINIAMPFYLKKMIKITSCTTILFGLLLIFSFISLLLSPLLSKMYFSPETSIKYRDVSLAMGLCMIVINGICIYLLNILGPSRNSSNNYSSNESE